MRNGTRASRSLGRDEIGLLVDAELLNADKLDRIDGVTTPDRPLPRRLCFIDHHDEKLLHALNEHEAQSMLVLAVESYRNLLPQAHVVSDRPRAHFAEIVRELFDYQREPQTTAISETAVIAPLAKIAFNVIVGRDSSIGAGTLVQPNVTIGDRVHIGRNCVIGSGTVIGQPGFGIYRDAEGVPHMLPQVAGVIIEDNVEIGASNTIAGGTIHPTIVGSSVKTDDQVHIAHNCRIGPRTIITACAEISGSVVIDEDVWLGPLVSVRDGLTIGARAYIGIGSNVVRSIEADTTAFGNPAKPRGKR